MIPLPPRIEQYVSVTVHYCCPGSDTYYSKTFKDCHFFWDDGDAVVIEGKVRYNFASRFLIYVERESK